jgi:hypothetical protein
LGRGSEVGRHVYPLGSEGRGIRRGDTLCGKVVGDVLRGILDNVTLAGTAGSTSDHGCGDGSK